MFASMTRRRTLGTVVVAALAFAVLLALAAFSPATEAAEQTNATGPITIENHSWGGYHWARPGIPFTVKLGDNVSSGWDSYLATTSSDWSHPPNTTWPDVLDAPVLTPGGLGQSPSSRQLRKCPPTSGRVEVCNTTYGQNGRLGVAQIWVTDNVHITQGTVKVNDTYFNNSFYNNPNEKEHVMCQEVGHTFGLDHQDESGASLDTCMDYFSNTGGNSTSTKSTHPNQHDYDELKTIYNHTTDTLTTIGQSATSKAPPASGEGEKLNTPNGWGQKKWESSDGSVELWERKLSKDGKDKLLTWVIKAKKDKEKTAA